MIRSVLLVAAAAAIAMPLDAQPAALAEAVQAGQVGERYDGYMGVTGAATPQVQRQVRAINIQRRNLYLQLSERRNVSPDLVGMAAACQLLSNLPAGEAYMLADGVWRHHAGGQAIPLPDYCR